jgi:hypothetical protein
MQSQQKPPNNDCDPVEAVLSKFAELVIGESKRDAEIWEAM